MNRTTNTSFNAISLKCEKKYRQQTVIIRAAGTVLIYAPIFFVNIPRQTAQYQIPKSNTTIGIEINNQVHPHKHIVIIININNII